MFHALDRKITGFPQGPPCGLCGEFSLSDLPSQRLTDLRIDEVGRPQRLFFSVQPIFDHLRIWPVAKEFNED